MNNTIFPRRINLSLNHSAELAIHNAMCEVEKVGADEKLTKAVTLLAEAKDLVSDYIDQASSQQKTDS